MAWTLFLKSSRSGAYRDVAQIACDVKLVRCINALRSRHAVQHELPQAGRMFQRQLPWIRPLGGTWMKEEEIKNG